MAVYIILFSPCQTWGLLVPMKAWMFRRQLWLEIAGYLARY